MPQYPKGYVAPIRQALWKRPTIWGVPHLWCMSWVFVCFNALAWGLMAHGWRWVIGTVVVWALGYEAMRRAFRMDPHCDKVLWAQWTRRYRHYYEAG